jgi:hypothetical protein
VGGSDATDDTIASVRSGLVVLVGSRFEGMLGSSKVGCCTVWGTVGLKSSKATICGPLGARVLPRRDLGGGGGGGLLGFPDCLPSLAVEVEVSMFKEAGPPESLDEPKDGRLVRLSRPLIMLVFGLSTNSRTAGSGG